MITNLMMTNLMMTNLLSPVSTHQGSSPIRINLLRG